MASVLRGKRPRDEIPEEPPSKKAFIGRNISLQGSSRKTALSEGSHVNGRFPSSGPSPDPEHGFPSSQSVSTSTSKPAASQKTTRSYNPSEFSSSVSPDNDRTSSNSSQRHTYYIQGGEAQVTCDGVDFKLEIGAHKKTREAKMTDSSTATKRIYKIQDMSIQLSSDGHNLKLTIADTRKDENEELVCCGSIFQIDSEPEYCHLTIIDRDEFLMQIDLFKKQQCSERYVHLNLRGVSGALYCQNISKLFATIEDFEGIQLDAVLDTELPYDRHHVIPITVNVYSPRSREDQIKSIFFATTLIKPMSVAPKFRALIQCNGDKAKRLLYCEQLFILAISNYVSITERHQWCYKWQQGPWLRRNWNELDKELGNITEDNVRLPTIIEDQQGIDESEEVFASRSRLLEI